MIKIEDKKELVKLCSFIVMGDGGVYYNGKNCYFVMNMKKENSDYVYLCKDILENITSCRISDRKDYNTDGYTRKEQLRLESKTHPFFNVLRDRIYTDKYKGIDSHALKLLDYEALSFLYMSDGNLYRYLRPEINMKNESYSVNLNLKRLSYGDLFILKKALKEKLDLEWNINRHGKYFYLRLRNKDLYKFMKGITPYITPSFSYKILDANLLNKDGDIVCSSKKLEESSRNDLAV